MTTSEILLSIVLGLAINEVCDVSPWLARHIVRLAARLRYSTTERSRARAEDTVAYIETRPGKLLKLGAALCFLAVGSAAFAHRRSRALAGRIFAHGEARNILSTRPRTRIRVYSVLASTLAISVVGLFVTIHYEPSGIALAVSVVCLAASIAGLGYGISVLRDLFRSRRSSSSTQGRVPRE